MNIRHLATLDLITTEHGLFIDRRSLFKGVAALGLLSGPVLIPSTAPGQSALARYIFQKFAYPAAVAFGEAVWARCTIFNAGNNATRQVLTGTLTGVDGSVEDEESANLYLEPKKLELFQLDLDPDDAGIKKLMCTTSDDSRVGRVRVTA
jgi:hypothetical protein